jgi:hypothetical protein
VLHQLSNYQIAKKGFIVELLVSDHTAFTDAATSYMCKRVEDDTET